LVEQDEGWTPTRPKVLAKLKPVRPGASTVLAPNFPRDGNCGIIVPTRDKAKALSVRSQDRSTDHLYGFARVKPAYMRQRLSRPLKMALAVACLKITDMKAIKTHNPFATNDLNLAKKMGVDVMKFKQLRIIPDLRPPSGTTAGRGVIEMVEEVVLLGGGYGLFTGCAAGRYAAAIILKVG